MQCKSCHTPASHTGAMFANSWDRRPLSDPEVVRVLPGRPVRLRVISAGSASNFFIQPRDGDFFTPGRPVSFQVAVRDAERVGSGGLGHEALARMDVAETALEALVAFRDPALFTVLPEVLSSGTAPFIRRAFTALGRVEDPKLADVLLGEYPKLKARGIPPPREAGRPSSRRIGPGRD